MKVAVLFRGQLRPSNLFNNSFRDNVLSNIPNADFQFFAHFWNTTSSISSNEHRSISSDEIDVFSNNFSPINILREDQKTVKEIRDILGFKNDKIYDHNGLPNGHGTSRISQFYSFYKSFQLMEEYEKDNGKFDLFISTRTDIFFINAMNYGEIDDYSLFARRDGNSSLSWVNDMFFLTKNRDCMESLSKISLYLDQIPVSGCSEQILASYLFDVRKINVKTLSMSVDLSRHHE